MDNRDIEPLYSEQTKQDIKSLNIGKVTEQDKLFAAKQILGALAALFAMAMVLSLLPTKASHSLLEIYKTIIPPSETQIKDFVCYLSEIFVINNNPMARSKSNKLLASVHAGLILAMQASPNCRLVYPSASCELALGHIELF